MPGPALLGAAGLTRSYSLAAEVITALDAVTFEVQAGDFLAVMGPSGSGKSTLLNLLGGLDRPTNGSVFWKGREFSHLSERRLSGWRCEEIGFVFQDAQLMSGLDALGNVRLPQVLAGRSQAVDQARELLSRFGLESKLSRLPGQLSRGEQQRVAVARALANNPACVLADEPTGNLDQSATEHLFATFGKLCAQDGLTIVVATHDESIRSYVGRTIVLSDGRLTQERDT